MDDSIEALIDEMLLLLPVLGRGIGRPTAVELEELPDHKMPEESQVSTGHIQIMITLARGAHSIGGLAEALGVSRPAVTQLVDRLAGYGLVERRHDSEDRRVVLVDFAAEDREVARRIMAARRRPLERAVGQMEEGEARAFLRGLKLLADEFHAEHHVD
jgi:DNA-binding MarR family transcriptional regulator